MSKAYQCPAHRDSSETFWIHQNTVITEPYVLMATCHLKFLLEDIRAGLPERNSPQTILSAGSRKWFLPNSIPNPSFSGPPLDMLLNQLPSQDLQGKPRRICRESQGGPAGTGRVGPSGVSCLPAFPKPQRGVHRRHEVFAPKAVSPFILRNLSIDKLV